MSGQAVLAVIVVAVLAPLARCHMVAPLEELGPRGFVLGANLQALPDNPLCQQRASSCSSDCASLIRCAFVTDVWQYVSTAACPASTPHCALDNTNEAICTATVPADGAACNPAPPQALPAGTFNCSADGYWPDLTSCTRYYLCVGTQAYRFDCSAFPNTVYDQRTAHCVPKKQATCYTLRCTAPKANKPLEYNVYTPAPWIYAVCTTKDASQALVGTCGNERLSVNSEGTCVEVCTAAGRFAPLTAAAGDVTSYVDCVDLGNGKFSDPTPGTCPAGTTFNATLGQCVITTTP